MKDVRILGVDLGKNSCSIVGLDGAGRVLLRRRTRREGVIALAAKLPGCVVAMEACCGAHHLGRLLAEQGHEVRLMSPEYVRPYVKAQKNDDRDAEAIAEAATRPTMRFVALKSEAQLDVPGRSCATRPGSSPAAQQWRRTGSAGGDHPTSRAVEGLRVVEARWPDSQPVSQQPMPSNGTRCRPLYQDRDARISILARVEP